MNDLSSATLAPAPNAVLSPSTTASRTLAVAEALQPDLAQGFQIDSLRLRLEMERAFGGSEALLHKSAADRTSPFPGQIYPATSVMGVPSAVKPLSTATRTWNSAT